MRLIYKPEDYYTAKAPKTLELIDADKTNWRAVCPFCEHKSGKFYIHKEGGYYQCWNCSVKGSMIKYHAHFAGLTEAEAYIALSTDGEVSTIAQEPTISEDVVSVLHKALITSQLAQDAIKKLWLVNDEAIEHFKLGLKDGYCCFPVYNKQGKCVNIRMKRIWPREGDPYPKYRNYQIDDKEIKFSKPRLYPYDVVTAEQEIFLVAGEKDMVSTWSKGIKNVITTTHGEGTFPSNFAFDLSGKKIHIVYDNDRPGFIDAKKVYDELKHIAEVDIVTLPKMEPYGEGKLRKDLTDFWMLGYSEEDLQALIKKSKIEKPQTLELIRRGPSEFKSLLETQDTIILDSLRPSFIDRYINYASARVNSPSQYHRLCGLWLCSNLLGRNCISMAEGYGILPNLWAVIVGPSTGVSKSATTLTARAVLDYVDKDCVALTSFTPQGLYKRLSMREDEPATAVYFDEISNLFDQVKNLDFMAGARETLIKVFNCEPITYDKAKEEVSIKRSYTTILGNGTPSGLAEVLSDVDVQRGLLVRFLVCIQHQQMEFRPEKADESFDQSLDKLKIYQEAKDIRARWAKPWRLKIFNNQWLQPRDDDPNKDKNQYRFYFGSKALDRYNEFRRVTEYGTFPNEQIAIAHQRLPMLLRKLSTIYAGIDPNTETFGNTAEVKLEHILQGIRDLNEYRSSMVELINNVGLTPIEKLINKVIDLIYRTPRITRQEIARELRGTSIKDVDLVLATCSDRGIIRSNKLPSGNIEYLVAS